MIAVIQRVNRASVDIDSETVGEIGKGFLILLGVADGDGEKDSEALAVKIEKLRIFSDENGKMNLSLCDVGGEALVVSNFTLLANYKKGNRPDYFASAKPEEAKRLYEHFVSAIGSGVKKVATGVFGADMQVSLCNDGPVTLVLDSRVLLNK